MDLMQKHAHLLERQQKMLQAGLDEVVVCIDRILSPTHAIINGRETVLAGTNNYMGITFAESCIEAGKRALDDFGTGTTGSRVANGTYAMHRELEEELAKFLNRRSVIVFTTGYQANLGMIAGLAGANDTVYLDADSHASIYDGCAVSGAQLVRFRHNDPDNLAKRLARANDEGEGGRLVILEGIYSMYGDRPPLKEFIDVKREYGYTLLLDEAHSFGVLGENGRGVAEEAGLEDEVDFIVGTFSKSIGSIGGFGASDHPLFDLIRYATRAYMFTASPSPSTIATSTAAVRELAQHPEFRDRLRYNSKRLHEGFKDLGLKMCCDVVSPVVAVHVEDEASTVAMWNALLQEGVYVNLALPPGTPNNSCLLRCSVSAAHSDADIDKIIELFGNVVAHRETRAAE